MNTELTISLEQRARELCSFYDYLNFLDQGILLSLIAVMSEDANQAVSFITKLRKKKKYQKRLGLLS